MDGMETPEAGVSALATPKEIEKTLEEKARDKKAIRMAYYGIRPGTVGQGTPEVFAEDDKPPVFYFELMTATDKQEFDDLFCTNYRLDRAKVPAAQRWVIDRKLKGWDYYVDQSGQPYVFAREGACLTAECWDTIPLPLRADLLTMIISANAPTAKEDTGVKS